MCVCMYQRRLNSMFLYNYNDTSVRRLLYDSCIMYKHQTVETEHCMPLS